MLRKIVLLGLGLVILVASSIHAQDITVAGYYNVTRQFDNEGKKYLETIGQEHTELIQTGKNAEAKKLMEEKIIPLKKNLEKLEPVRAGTMDFSIRDDSFGDDQEKMLIVVYHSAKAGSDSLITGHNLEIPIDVYYALFETDKVVKLKNITKDITEVWANGKKENRRIYVEKKHEKYVYPEDQAAVLADTSSIWDIRIINGQITQIDIHYSALGVKDLSFKDTYKAILKLEKRENGILLECNEKQAPEEIRVNDFITLQNAAQNRDVDNFLKIGGF